MADEPQIILGIDPGSRITGFGIIKIEGARREYMGSGCIRTEGTVFADKLKQIYDGVTEVITQYKPSLFAIEQCFVSKNVASTIKLAHARTAAIIAALNHNLEIGEYSPRQIKQSVAGYGNAGKVQVQHMVCTILKLNATPQADAADAGHSHHPCRHTAEPGGHELQGAGHSWHVAQPLQVAWREFRPDLESSSWGIMMLQKKKTAPDRPRDGAAYAVPGHFSGSDGRNT